MRVCLPCRPFFMEMLDHIVKQVGDAGSLNGWRLGAFALAMWWSKVLGQMVMMWWEQVKVAQWQKELGLDPPRRSPGGGTRRKARRSRRSAPAESPVDGQ